MTRAFEIDPYPGRPKILFVGNSVSTHTHSWIDLLENARLNVRLFSLDDGSPPSDWPVKTYLTCAGESASPSSIHRRSFLTLAARRKSLLGMAVAAAKLFKLRRPTWFSVLANVVRAWKPDVIHTLGLFPASYDYFKACQLFDLKVGTWVAQVRGGPDLFLNQHIPYHVPLIREVITNCDQLIADNQQNYDLLARMGVSANRLSPLGVVPGSGGIDVGDLSRRWPGLPSRRERIIVWPKAYEVPSSKALPVFEAIRIAWPRMRPCRIYLLWADKPEVRAWFAKLPQEIQDNCELHDRIPRAETLELFLRARIMLAPSLTDGIPNSMLEAMACGAFPIVSPIDTLVPLIQSPDHTIFARNLYPDEIADALVRAMKDDALVDAAAQRNLAFVTRQSNRDSIRPRVIRYYEDLAAQKATPRTSESPGRSGKEKSAA